MIADVGLDLLWIIAALGCLVLAALNITHPRISFGWLGLAFWALSLLI